MATASRQGAGMTRVPVKCLGIALAAALLTLLFFSPNFASWQALDTRYLWRVPECSRAKSALAQIDDPWAPINNDVHRVIGWRLLFPLTWHYLSLPRWLYLAMPHVGCVLALWLTARVAQLRLRDWVSTALAVLVFATLPWFFVSTGWLAYFDSWLILALMTVAFVPSRWAVGAACVLAPWIDERIVLALPVCLLVRTVALGYATRERRSELWFDLAVVLIASLPYPAARAVAWLRGDPQVADYLAQHWQQARDVPWSRYAAALWYGYRAACVFVLAAIWFCFERAGRTWGAALALVTAITALGSLATASDMTRSLMMVCPVMLLGIWLWHDARPKTFRWVLPAVAAANLLLPATHVMWEMKTPIVYLRSELLRWEIPPAFLDPKTYLQEGQTCLNLGKYPEAAQALDTAIDLDPRQSAGHLLRGLLYLRQGDLDAAQREADTALGIDPDLADGLYLRATITARRGNRSAAVPDLQRALQVAPGDWPRRGEAQQFLNSLTAP